ncbi:MAG TPA: TatD family hydrolase [Arenimonas sp.]|uniref:TatD family hydrolase n=1 Tax=Arenimonas sp. TaxID=1872635 RepID=UPI002D7EB001|nr:TatD family hydrolase [Arenimonas sp.]HEU0153774.1 TatD family hydrolase [Arenimonas sp.]
MTALYDSHCHLDAPEFDPDRPAVVGRARAAGVQWQLVPAVTRASWPGLRAACALDPGLVPAYGLHPMFLDQHRDEDLDELATWLAEERPAAVGECGLDYFVEGLDPARQRHFFQAQLDLARTFDLPVVLHARRAVDEVITRLRRTGGLRGVVHSWSGSEEQARQLFDLGFHLGIGGPVTFERAQRLRRTVAGMPIEYLLLETDAPDQPGAAHRGQRNEPAYLAEVLATVAQLRGESPEAVAAATTANARRLFVRPPASA